MNSDNRLGAFLKDRRGRLDPAAFGLPALRRRTPGLRREEVAQRAHISATWYTWLEQGRGGAPSAEALERIAAALMLTEAEREHLFLLGLGRQPDVRYGADTSVTPRLQRVLDALNPCPAMIKTRSWDVVAWNRAAAVVLTDYGALEREQRNILRQVFLSPRVRNAQTDWDSVSRFVVDSFRADAARCGDDEHLQRLIAELCAASADFARLWAAGDVRRFGEGLKRLQHAQAGELVLEHSAFAVEGRPDLTMLVYSPASEESAARIGRLLALPAATVIPEAG